MNNIACVLNDMSTPPRPKEALVWSQKAYDLIQKSGKMVPTIYDTHGWVLISAGQLDDGIEVLHQGIDKSAFPDAFYHLGRAYLMKGQPKDAQRELNRAMEMLNKPETTFVEVDKNLRTEVGKALKEANEKVQAEEDGKPST
jgi:tetratricopeptide (TPR) repeat protein